MSVFCIDIETTGTNINRDVPVQISLSDSSGSTVYNTYCDPGDIRMTREAYDVHGIGEEQYRGKISYTAAAAEVAEIILDTAYWRLDPVLVGHNISTFDLPILNRIYPSSAWTNSLVFDTYHAFMRDVCNDHSKEFPSDWKLARLYQYYTGKEMAEDGAHDSSYDTVCCFEAAKVMVGGEEYERFRARATIMGYPSKLTRWPWGKYRGRDSDKIPFGYANYFSRMKDLPADVERTVRHRLCQQHV